MGEARAVGLRRIRKDGGQCRRPPLLRALVHERVARRQNVLSKAVQSLRMQWPVDIMISWWTTDEDDD